MLSLSLFSVLSLAGLGTPRATSLADDTAAEVNADLAHALETVDVADIRALEFFLASDFLRGRATPSVELEIAAEFLASQFQAAGLTEIGDGGYFQAVHLPATRAPDDGLLVELVIGDAPLDLANALVLSGCREEPFEVPDSDLLWVGSPQRLPTLDVELARGRTALVLAETAADPNFGATETMSAAYLSFFARSLQLRAIVVVCDNSHGIALSQAAEQSRSPTLRSRRRGSNPPVLFVGPIDRNELAEAVEIEVAELSAAEPRSLEGRFSAAIPAAVEEDLVVRNVVAQLRGSDPVLADEYVLVSAHYDHIGVRPFGEGDLICNGADDDASGTVAVVEIARTLASLPVPPRRSILFVCFCGEELGLLGSGAYSRTPLVPVDKTIANVNIEMIGRPDDIGAGRAWVTGFQYSEMPTLLAEAAAELGVEVFQHPELDERLFRASDNYSLASLGIPAHSLSAGSLHADYHQPSDEVDRLDFPHMTRIVQALVLGVHRIASREERPAWHVDPATFAPRGNR